MPSDCEKPELIFDEIPVSEALLQACPDGIILMDALGNVAMANPAAASLLGPEAGPADNFFDRIVPEDAGPVRKAVAESRAGDSLSLRFRLRAGDGRVFPVEAKIRGVARQAGGKGYVASLREISVTLGLRPADGDRRARSRLLGAVMDRVPVMVCRVDARGVIRESFGGGLRNIGLGDGQAVGMNAFEAWPSLRGELRKAFEGETIQFEFESGRAERRVLDVKFFPDPDDPESILGFGVDITDRKRVEDELGKSEALNRRIIESSRDCITLLDVDGRIHSISKNGLGLLEMEDGEVLLGMPWSVLWAGEEHGKADKALQQALSRGIGKFHGFGPTAKGRPKWWDVVVTPILAPDGAPERLLAVARDITETKEFEETLRRSRDQLEAVLKAITDAVLVTDPRGTVVYANDAAAALFGIGSGREIPGSSPEAPASAFEIRDEEGKPIEGKAFPSSLRERAGKVIRFRRRGEKAERWLSVNSAHIRDSQGRIVLHIDTAYDLTERKQAEDALRKSEEQLRQSHKMEAMGRLAGGVAHDFNNLLTAINGYGEILAHSMAEDDPLRDNVEEIRRAGERAATLTRQLLTFSRKQMPSRRVVDLNHSVAEIRQMLVRLIGEDVELVTSSDPDPARVNVDPGQVEQLILNLALNSRDAMPMGGRLLIETSNVRLDPRQSGVFFPVDAGSYVRLTVTDSGFGMTEEVKAHLFEPFFTTKQQGQGTGLGLCTVYGIVKQAGGNISVWSEPGRGTSISIFLPALEPEYAQDVRTKFAEAAADPSSGRETVLLAEDEEVVRRLVSQLLTTQGYRVLAAGSGAEALDMAGRHGGNIDLLLTDVVMVGMSGRELAEKLLTSRPNTKVLYMSGYTDDAILRHGVYQSSAAFLSKPFSTVTLIRKIRDVLETQESGKSAAGAAVPALAEFPSPAQPN
jgi:two-component system cell cycle sensor histidine kinase/response regulator CckA